MKILDRLRMQRMCSRPQWVDMSTNDRNNGSWARLCLRFPLKNLESRVKGKKKKKMKTWFSKDVSLISCFCLSTLLRCSLICFPCCRETKRSRQFHHHHAGACPANVERDLLQEDREVNMQPLIGGCLKKNPILLHADKRVTEARLEKTYCKRKEKQAIKYW